MTEYKRKTSLNSKQPLNLSNQDQTVEKKQEPTPILNYKLYFGGYADIKGFTVAENQEEAINDLRKELRLFTLPCDVEEVILPNYNITLTLKENAGNS